MTNIFIFGVHGKMGALTRRLAQAKRDVCVSGGFSTKRHSDAFTSIDQVSVPMDVIVDFSSPSATDDIVRLCQKNSCALLVASTGHTPDQIERIKFLSFKHPVMISPNLSIGVNLFFALTEFASRAFSHADTCIIDYHHSQKKDAPSGTAKALAKAIENGKNNRQNRLNEERMDREPQVATLSMRGGTIVGKHDVIFACHGETITLTHNAESRKIFADGAIEVATWLAKKSAGLYSVKDYIREALHVEL